MKINKPKISNNEVVLDEQQIKGLKKANSNSIYKQKFFFPFF